jgi:hypothetical protein
MLRAIGLVFISISISASAQEKAKEASLADKSTETVESSVGQKAEKSEENQDDKGDLLDKIAAKAADVAIESYEDESIFAWELKKRADGFLATVVSENDLRNYYRCSEAEESDEETGPEIDCTHVARKFGREVYVEIPNLDLAFVKKAQKAALSTLYLSLSGEGVDIKGDDGQDKNIKLDLSTVTEMKIWTHQKPKKQSSHAHGPNVWVKFTFIVEGQTVVRYVVCHTHKGKPKINAHIRASGQNEPTRAFENQ